MAARGRPALPRNVFSYEAGDVDLPDIICLDTTFAVNALLSAEAHHASARRYLERLAENNTWLVFSHLLELELREVCFRAPLIQTYPRDWRRRRHDGRSLRRARRLIEATMAAWEELLTAFAYGVTEVEAVYEGVPALMGRGLQSYDAVHASTARMFAEGNLLTTDAGFAAIPADELTLYVNSSRVAWCRRVRAAIR